MYSDLTTKTKSTTMKRRNILLSLAAFPALAVARPLLPLEISDPIYTIYIIANKKEKIPTIFSGTKKEIKKQLLERYRFSYYKGHVVKFVLHKGELNMDTLDTELKEICYYLAKNTPLKWSYECIRGYVKNFDESSVDWMLYGIASRSKKYNLTNGTISV